MIVNVINCVHRTDRLQHFLQQAEEQQFGYKIWGGIIDNNIPCVGISKSYKRIIQSAKENNDPCCIIAEDDICYSAPNAHDYFISQIPDNYDLFMGSVYTGTITEEGIVGNFSGFTLTIVHSRFYDTFLSTPENNHIDRQMFLHKGVYKVCDPFVCYQLDGYSDNAGKKTDYFKRHMNGRKFFGATSEGLKTIL